MGLVNVDELDTPELAQRVERHVIQVGMKESIKVRSSMGRTHLVSEQWEWEQLRDYVATQIEQRFGPFPRNPIKEASIFKSFVKRWGDQAPIIAKAAFEHYDGWWRGAPISITRFCKGSDDWFARKILDISS
jgi:hypothetical protein